MPFRKSCHMSFRKLIPSFTLRSPLIFAGRGQSAKSAKIITRKIFMLHGIPSSLAGNVDDSDILQLEFRNQVNFILPHCCGISLLRTPNECPDGVRYSESKLYLYKLMSSQSNKAFSIFTFLVNV